MTQNTASSFSSWLVWVYPHPILSKFNVAPRVEIAKEMRNLGWKVDLIAVGPRGRHLVQGVEALLFPTLDVYFLRHLIFHISAIGYVLQNWTRIDVVMFHQISALWVLPLRLLFLFGGKHPVFVLDTRTVTMEAVDGVTRREKIRKWFYSLMNNLANRFTDGQTTITKRMADLLRVPKDKLWGTWPSGVEIKKFSAAVHQHHWPGDPDPVIIIYIGSLHHGRNIMALCQAVEAANGEGMNVEFVMYGEGTEKDDLRAFAAKTNGCVKLCDTVPHDQVPKILAAAHVGALPFLNEDKYNVSSPIKLFEYMGAGLPILATRIPCHTDVMGDGAYVFWAEDGSIAGLLDAIRKIWHSRLSLASMGEKSSTTAYEWTYVASAKRLNDALCFGLAHLGRLNAEGSVN